MEAGVIFLSGQFNRPDLIRENHYYYNDQDYHYGCGFVIDNKTFFSYSFGLKAEYSLNKRIAIASGVRYNFFKAVLNSDRDYFLWKVSETETSANYITIKNISQKNYYIGIPLELKLFPREKDYFVRQYFIFGTLFNFLVVSNSEVAFQNQKMEKYSSEVMKNIGNPNRFQTVVYAGVGLKIGKLKYPVGNIEFHFPVLTFGKNNPNSFTKTAGSVGFGIRTTFQIPVIKKHQIIYTVED